MCQDLGIVGAPEGHTIGADLTQADPVAPPLPGENHGLQPAAVVPLRLDDGQALPETEEPPDVEAALEGRAAAAPDLELHDAAGAPASQDLQILELADRDVPVDRRL